MQKEEEKLRYCAKKAKFIGGLKLNSNERIELTFVVSIGNEGQKGEALRAYIRLINAHKRNIHTLKILLGDDLQSHYYGIEKAHALGDVWLEENQSILKEEISPDIKLIIDRWQSLDLTKYILTTNNLYNNDEKFRLVFECTVSDVQNRLKRNINEIKNCLIEEVASGLALTGYLSHPGKLNKTLQYIFDNINKNAIYVGYGIFPNNANVAKVLPTEDTLQDTALKQTILASQQLFAAGYKTFESQMAFFGQVARMRQLASETTEGTHERTATENNYQQFKG